MARKRRVTGVQERSEYQCRHCANSYDWHSRAIDGHLILCRCRYRQEGGKYCIFLSDPACVKHFKLREGHGEAEKQV